ncbi:MULTISPECIES: NADH-ubiquinone oxidoreductase-F iron-sulfur binding region domain-containing protein [unclassified Haloferax]|uniref:NADH-ubiquinone oxidoreductase-F iron-sulfur binding region domain-containing protein n=1 Tax=unclassified Haloferax TaxID=2625095 RepID=UPI0028746251|nr:MULTISPECIES: NADH-ubiquinone oxidoreductase-F iron-sulfur binding region domain-containing protein [unclassified Haloferax]MDS0241444.1 NADH dehydrogenase FAD-containing subunit [Haloferax sp. S2CR25]MDS0444565.1 NADH dehydrogenase FAD-containing subunit [Haloferax sp. S2CR25-2]
MNRTGKATPSPTVRVSGAGRTERGERVLSSARAAADSVPVLRTGPTGISEYDPLVLATRAGRTAFFPAPDAPRAREIVADVEDGALPTDGAAAVVEHDAETTTLPVPTNGPLAVGRRRVLGPCGWVDPLDPEGCQFQSLDKDAGAIADAGLVGRGRGDASADDPVADAWRRARETDGDPVVVVNANDADDRQWADETLLAGSPMSVLDGVAAVAEYLGTTDAVIYLAETDTELREHLRRAVDAAADELPVVPRVATGPDEYRAGAPTAALEAIEGADRIEPRLQPPSPAEYGLFGRPTVIHSPRTFAQVHHALSGPESTDEDGSASATRLLTVSGDVAAPATIEVGSDARLSAVRNAVELEGSFKMACVGGVFGGVTRTLDITPTADELTAAGLGTDGVVELLNDERCPVATAGQRANFASEANSGRCVPGREGTVQLTELVRAVYRGSYDREKIRELGRVMARSSNCRIGARAPRPVLTAMDEFESSFEAHADGRCPSGTCTDKL